MEPIKELEDCVDAVFNSTKTLKESAEDILPNTSDASFDAPLSDNSIDDQTNDLSNLGAEFEEGDLVKVVDSEDPQLNGTEWIYDGPSDSNPNMAEVHSKIDDKVMEIDYSKIQKVSNITDQMDEDDDEEDINDTESPLDSVEDLNEPRNESKSIEDVVMSVLEFAPVAAAAATTTASTGAAASAGAGAMEGAMEGAAIAAGQKAVTDAENKGKEAVKSAFKPDDKPVIECDETNKECPKCQSTPCKCETETKKRKFVTKNVKESFEQMKKRKLTEAKEKGFSV